MPLNPKHLPFPWVFHPHTPPRPPPKPRLQPRVDTIGVGHIHLFTKQVVRRLIPLQRGGFLAPLLLLRLLPLLPLPMSTGVCRVQR